MTAVSRHAPRALAAALFLAALAPAAASASEAQALVDKARLTVQKLFAHEDTSHVRGWAKEAKGVMIVPNLLKVGLLIGGGGGQGVLLARDAERGWSAPAFYAIGSGSFGLQAGFQSAELMLILTSESALRAMIESNVKLGVDASVAAGPVGVGVAGATAADLGADIVAYALTRGAFVGAAVDGSVAVEEEALNAAYYGPGATAREIVLDRRFFNSAADGLIRALEGG